MRLPVELQQVAIEFPKEPAQSGQKEFKKFFYKTPASGGESPA